jgi:hypothetical protein
LNGSPSCVSRADQIVDCFVPAPNGGIAHIGWDGGKWKDWENLGNSKSAGAPACLRLDQSSVGCYFLDNSGALDEIRLSTSKPI